MKIPNLFIVFLFVLVVIFSGCAVNHTNSGEDTLIVYIDSVAIPVDSVNNTIITLHHDGVDTIPGKLSKVFGRIYYYSLVSVSNLYPKFNDNKCKISIGKDSISGMEPDLNGNNFVVDVDTEWVHVGMNKIRVFVENTVGESCVAESKLYFDDFFMVGPLSPQDGYDFGMERKYGNGTIWSDSLGNGNRLIAGLKFKSCSNIDSCRLYFDNNRIYSVNADTDESYIGTDTIVVSYWAKLTDEPLEGEHKIGAWFNIKGSMRTIKVVWNIYVDNTKPDINIIEPEAGKTYYPRVDSTMNIVLQTSDDSMQQYFPKADSIIMEIDSLAGNDYVNVFRYKVTNGMHLYYGDLHVYKWNYLDNSGHPVPSGEYRLKVFVYDHAGNEKDTSVIFTIDNNRTKLFVSG